MSLFRNSLIASVVRQKGPTPIAKWAVKASTITSPDHLIAGHIIGGFSKDFEAWLNDGLIPYSERRCNYWKHDTRDANVVLENKKAKLKFEVQVETYREGADKYRYVILPAKAFVNDVPISEEAATRIIEAYFRVRAAWKAAQEAAARAEKAMKENEALWNLYEKMSGFKRNAFGALVPCNQCDDTSSQEHQEAECTCYVKA